MQPPRTLWVTFPLGRPLGKPNDPAFQMAVIRSALSLMDRSTGPVLEDFPHDAPPVATEHVQACPVSFPKTEAADESWAERLKADLAAVMPWYDLSRRRRQRTLVGVAEHTPEENIATLGQLLDDDELPFDALPWFKHAVEDLKVLYLEALTAQPGEHDHESVQRTFWQESVLGAALVQFYHRLRSSEDRRGALIARIIVPREAVGRSSTESD